MSVNLQASGYRAVLAKATSIGDLKPWHSKATRAKMDATPKDEAGVTLHVEAIDAEKAKTTGEVSLVREDRGCKRVTPLLERP